MTKQTTNTEKGENEKWPTERQKEGKPTREKAMSDPSFTVVIILIIRIRIPNAYVVVSSIQFPWVARVRRHRGRRRNQVNRPPKSRHSLQEEEGENRQRGHSQQSQYLSHCRCSLLFAPPFSLFSCIKLHSFFHHVFASIRTECGCQESELCSLFSASEQRKWYRTERKIRKEGRGGLNHWKLRS